MAETVAAAPHDTVPARDIAWETVELACWGRAVEARSRACRPRDEAEVAVALATADESGILAHGGGRSYGDAAFNDGGRTILTERLDGIGAFDAESGILVCGPGVTIRALTEAFLPRGYISAVNPGTGFATLGGAIANDVHGKNHDRAGSFGDHLLWLDLALPSGEVRRVSPEADPELFDATIGGIGLTGVITRLCLRLMKVPSAHLRVREKRMADLDGFMSALDAARRGATYSVGWIDALSRGGRFGRGILETAEFAPAGDPPALRPVRDVPFDFPGFALNPLSVRLFNEAYYRRVPAAGRVREVVLDRFFFPLDAIGRWNRIYGRRGFYQFQGVIPDAEAGRGIPALLEAAAASGQGSFLTVLKTLGGEGRGHLSFPLSGFTLALDFPRRRGTRELLGRLERIAMDHGGRVYLAKDGTLTPESFRAMYPKLDAFREVLARVDPAARLNSDMARRLEIRG